MKQLKQICEDVLGLWSLVKGLKITGGYFFSRQATVHYPRACVDNLDTFRGPLELVPNPDDPEQPLCIACMTCATTCPTGAILVVKRKAPEPDPGAAQEDQPPQKPPKGPAKFRYDYTVCCQCGLCVENCPKGAIRLSGNPFSASTQKGDFQVELLEQLKSRETGNRKPVTENERRST